MDGNRSFEWQRFLENMGDFSCFEISDCEVGDFPAKSFASLPTVISVTGKSES